MKHGAMNVGHARPGAIRLGIVGADPDIASLAAAAAARGDTVVALDGPDVDAGCDAIAVGSTGWDATRAEAVRMLVQTGRTLVLAQPLELSMLWAYELDMIRRDSGAVIVPFLPARLHPFIARLRTLVEAGVSGAAPLGPLESLRFERTMGDRTRATVLAALSRDVDLVRVLVGEPARLATLGAGDPDSAWPTLAVGFTGPGQVPVRWQVAPGRPTGLSITLQHAQGAVSIHAPDAGAWTWADGSTAAQPFDPGRAVLDELHRALGGQAAPPPAAVIPAASWAVIPAASWADASRAIELADTVPRSLARGRAVDLHQEEFSEISTFRGTMASLGCGLVLASLVVLILATLVAGVAAAFEWQFGQSLVSAWPLVLLGAMAVFLALQLLPFIVAERPSRHDDTPGDAAKT